MGKKVIRLTESELKEMIYEAVIPVLNEIDATTYSRVHRATNQARIDNRFSQQWTALVSELQKASQMI